MKKIGSFLMNAALAAFIFAILIAGIVGGVVGFVWICTIILGKSPIVVAGAVFFLLCASMGTVFAIDQAKKQ